MKGKRESQQAFHPNSHPLIQPRKRLDQHGTVEVPSEGRSEQVSEAEDVERTREKDAGHAVEGRVEVIYLEAVDGEVGCDGADFALGYKYAGGGGGGVTFCFVGSFLGSVCIKLGLGKYRYLTCLTGEVANGATRFFVAPKVVGRVATTAARPYPPRANPSCMKPRPSIMCGLTQH